MLIDGVKVNLAGGAIDLANLSVDNVERIEVVRGSASTLYGSSAMGGVIHIVTRRGSGPLSARLSVSSGSFGTHNQRAAVTAGTAWGSLSVAASRVDSDGHLAFNNQYDNANLSLRADLSPDEHTNLDLTLRHTDSEFHFPTDGTGAVTHRHQFSTTHETAMGLRGARALALGGTAACNWASTSVSTATIPIRTLREISPFTYDEERLAIDWQSVLDINSATLPWAWRTRMMRTRKPMCAGTTPPDTGSFA